MARVSVRPLSIRDVTSLRNLHQIHVPLGYKHSFVGHVSADVLAALPVGRRRWRAFVATLDDQVCALAELHPEPREFRWLVTNLAANAEILGESPDVCVDLWSDLLLAGVRLAAASGAKRLHASPPIDGPAIEALRRASFMVYANQTTLLAHGPRRGSSGGIALREQDPSDAWSVHQLYHLATPHPIQHAEAYTTNHWDTGRRSGWRIRGFLVDRGPEIAAYCRVASQAHRHVLELLTLPGEAGLLTDLVSAVLERLGVSERDAVWVGVADYHSDYIQPLEELGFEVAGRHAQMVRYTAVAAKARLWRSLRLVPEVSERLSARLPLYSVACSIAAEEATLGSERRSTCTLRGE